MIDYVQLSSGSQVRRYSTNMRDTSAQPNVFIRYKGIKGLLEPGENRSAPVDKTYSDGYVFNPRPTYSGKDISINLILHGTISQVENAYSNLVNFLRLGNFVLTTNEGHTYTVQYQTLETEDENYGRTRATKSVILYLAAKEAW